MEQDKKRLKQEYRQTHRPMGVFLIRNMVNDKVFVGTGLNLSGIINRHRFELTLGNHRNRQLQAEWDEFGSESFAFELLDQLHPREDPLFDYRADLAFMEEMWLEKLQPFGERGYNEPKPSREERLRRMAANRLSSEYGEELMTEEPDETNNDAPRARTTREGGVGDVETAGETTAAAATTGDSTTETRPVGADTLVKVADRPAPPKRAED